MKREQIVYLGIAKDIGRVQNLKNGVYFALQYDENHKENNHVINVFLSIEIERRGIGMEESAIYSYPRKQALKDGDLVDITTVAKKAGFIYPVAVTSSVWGLIKPPAGTKGQSIHWRLWDLLMTLNAAVRYKSAGKDRIRFPVIFDDRPVGEHRVERLWAMIHMGDDYKPVITIMREGEN